MEATSGSRFDDDLRGPSPTEESSPPPTEAVAVAMAPEFTMALRGYDRLQVDDYLERQGEWAAEMEARLAAAERSAEHHAGEAAALRERVDALAEDDEDGAPRSMKALGDRVGRILQTAWDTAQELRAEAVASAANEAEVIEQRAEEREARAAATLEEATERASLVRQESEDVARRTIEEAERLRSEAETQAAELRATTLAEATEEADAVRARAASEAQAMRAQAVADADAERTQASAEVEAMRADAEGEARRIVGAAEARRDELEHVIASLTERRESALAELDRVRAALEQVVALPATGSPAPAPATASPAGPSDAPPRVQ